MRSSWVLAEMMMICWMDDFGPRGVTDLPRFQRFSFRTKIKHARSPRSPHGLRADEKTAPDSDASAEPAKGARQDAAEPAKRGAGTVPQAVKQAAAVDEDAQRIAKEAAAAVAAAEPLKMSKDDDVWREYGGADLESALQVDPEHDDSPVALIDARYIVELWKRGGKILRRQDLPKEAFIDLETVKRLPMGNGDCLRVIAVSHPWQQPDHPDPKEVNLTLLAKVLERFIKDGDHFGSRGRATPTPVSLTS